MTDNKNMKENPEKIDEFVDRAISRDDYSDLSDLIEGSVETAIDFTRAGASAIMEGFKNSIRKKRAALPANQNPDLVAQNTRSPRAAGFFRNLSGIATVFNGGITISTIYDLFFLRFEITNLIFFGAMTLIFYNLTKKFHHEKKLLTRFNRYKVEIGNSRVLPVADFASAVGLSLQDAQEDLIALIKKNYFPQARLVEDGQLFILDKETYQVYKYKYLADREAGVIPKAPSQAQEEIQEAQEEEAVQAQEKEDKDSRLEVIDSYIRTLQGQVAKLSNPSFKEDVSKLIGILKAIEGQVKETPQVLASLNKLVDYYTPTTIKLIDRYIDFESSPQGVANVARSKADIEKSIQTVNRAFTNLLNELFNDDLIDIRTEIEVMETLMTQDGLIKGDHDISLDRD